MQYSSLTALAFSALAAGSVGCSSDDAAESGLPGTSRDGGGSVDGTGGSEIGAGDSLAEGFSGARSLRISFDRVPGSRLFDAHVRVFADDPSRSVTTWPIDIQSDRGSVGAVETVDDGASGGHFKARVTPDTTGRHTITAAVRSGSLRGKRTAVVLPQVDDAWNQPEPVGGLVNTVAWEDGADISHDGQWLIIQYLPVPLECVAGRDPAAASCIRAIGPITGPERPNMPGASRVGPDGTITNGCPSLGVPSLPFPVPPNSLYAFRRSTADPTAFDFEDPHPVYYDGADGCISAFGASMLDASPGKANLVYAFDSPLDSGANDTGADLFAAQVTLGSDVVLGRFTMSGGVASLTSHVGVSIGHPTEGNEGNLLPSRADRAVVGLEWWPVRERSVVVRHQGGTG